MNYSRTCLNPEKYEPFVSYNGKSCDTIYQELSSHGNRFSTIDWNTARKSDFSDNIPNEKISNETLLHFYSNTVGCCKDYKSILWKSPAPINGKKACEDHGFSQSQCTAVGCCQWQDSNRKCVSAVGENLCTTDSGKSCSQAASLLGYNCPPGHSPNSRCDPGCYYTPECKKDMNDCAGVTLQPIKVNALDDRSTSQLMNKTNIFLKDLYAVWLEKEINTCRNNSLSFLAMCPENYPCVQDICEVNRSAYNGTSANCSTLNVTDGSCAGSKFCRVHYNASINNLCCQNGVRKCANDALGKPYKNMLGCCNGCVNSSCGGFQIEDQLDQKLKWPRLNVCPATIGNSLKLIPGFPMDGYEYNGTCKPEKCGIQSDACYVKRDDASHVAEDFLRSNSFSFTDENINFGRNDLVSDATFYNDVRNYNDGSGYSMYRTNEAYYNKLMKMMFLRDLRVVSTEVTKVTTASLDLSWGNFSVILYPRNAGKLRIKTCGKSNKETETTTKICCSEYMDHVGSNENNNSFLSNFCSNDKCVKDMPCHSMSMSSNASSHTCARTASSCLDIRKSYACSTGCYSLCWETGQNSTWKEELVKKYCPSHVTIDNICSLPLNALNDTKTKYADTMGICSFLTTKPACNARQTCVWDSNIMQCCFINKSSSCSEDHLETILILVMLGRRLHRDLDQQQRRRLHLEAIPIQVMLGRRVHLPRAHLDQQFW